MVHQDMTPEERLLKLIKGKPKKTDGALKPPSTSILASKAKSKNISLISDKLSFLWEIFSLRRLRVGLLAVIILSLSYLVFQLMTEHPTLNLAAGRLSEAGDKKDEQQIEIVNLQPYSHYSQQFEKRDIFNAPFLAGRSVGAVVDASLDERIANLGIVGVVLDENPQVIIEDKKDGKTYFLNKGSKIGELKVSEISSNRVILSYEDEEFELVP